MKILGFLQPKQVLEGENFFFVRGKRKTEATIFGVVILAKKGWILEERREIHASEIFMLQYLQWGFYREILQKEIFLLWKKKNFRVVAE